jgi:hypothetical protein
MSRAHAHDAQPTALDVRPLRDNGSPNAGDRQ